MNNLPEIKVLETVDSTNTYLKNLAKENKNTPAFSAVLALSQTDGRGRLSRNWLSSEGETLCMSILLPRKGDSSITLLCALGVYNALGKFVPAWLQIKWPNDIIFENKKLCGILCESAGDFVVVGIGVNVNSLSFPEEIARKATSLRLITKEEYTLFEIANLIRDEIFFTLQKYNFTLTEDALKVYSSLCANIGREAKSEKISGITKGIDKSGALLVENKDGLFSISSGEIIVSGIY